MAKPVIVVTRKMPEAVEERLARDYEPRFNPDDHQYDADELIEKCQGADAIVCCHTERFSAQVMARLPMSIRAIACVSVGVDHVDLEAAKARGKIVTNTPDVLSDATAEIGMLLLLGAARRASEGERMMRAAAWKDWSLSFMVGAQVTGKRLGIVGMGRVGQVMARRARGFDMHIHYHNRRPLTPELERGAVYYPKLDDMLPKCEFLSLHCPATPETRFLMNRDRIGRLPDGAILVNTARGALIDDDALIGALRSRKLAAAGLDVYNNEPNVHPGYRELDNVLLLPHIGSATHETRIAMGNRALDNLDAVFANAEPRDRVA